MRFAIRLDADLPEVDKTRPYSCEVEQDFNWNLTLFAGQACAIVGITGKYPCDAVGALATWRWDDFDPDAWTDRAGNVVDVDRTAIVVITSVEQE